MSAEPAASHQYVVSVDPRPGHEGLEVWSHAGLPLDERQIRELASDLASWAGIEAHVRQKLVSEIAAYVRNGPMLGSKSPHRVFQDMADAIEARFG